MTIEIIEIEWDLKDYQQAFDLRNQVLRKPLGMDLKEEDLSSEKRGIHFGAKMLDQIIGVCFVEYLGTDQLKVRQVGVSEDIRGQGVGQQLLKKVESFALDKGIKQIELDAGKNAWVFYLKLGYQFEGQEILKFKTVWHRRMIKRLDEFSH